MYSVFGNTGVKEESANFVNTINKDKTETQINGEDIPDSGSFMKPGVQVGDKITYNIKWVNSARDEGVSVPAQVTITDPLDDGVDFVSASFGGVTVSVDDPPTAEETVTAAGTATVDGQAVNVTITYTKSTHTITWVIGRINKDGTDAPEAAGVPAGYAGEVAFSVIVNEDAVKKYTYDDAGKIDSTDSGENDDLILNQGVVELDNDGEALTEIIPNPTKPVKDEADVDGAPVETTVQVEESGNVKVGPTVKVGDVIRYTITWQNTAQHADGNGKAANVAVTDTLGQGLEFVAASFVTTDGSGADSYLAEGPAGCTVSNSGSIITWNLPNRDHGARGKVWVQARVTEDAFERVKNEAKVKVGDRDEQVLDSVENPVKDTVQLTVKKLVYGNEGEPNREFTFTVTLDDKSVNGPYGDMAFTDGVARFTLKHGESATATGLPAGAAYTVAEGEAGKDGYDTSSFGAEGTIPDQGTAQVQFVNSKDRPEGGKGNLTVTKTVAGTAGDKTRDWHFIVTVYTDGTGRR